MSKFSASGLVQHPVDAVFAANRDALAVAIAYVDDLEHVVRDRIERPDGVIELTNVWRASLPIPDAIQSVVKPHMVVWTDHSIWSPRERTCRWTLQAPFFPDHLTCSGVTTYDEAPRGATRMLIEGEIVVDGSGATALPAPLQRALARGIEEFVCVLFPYVSRKVMDAISRQLSDGPPSSRS